MLSFLYRKGDFFFTENLGGKMKYKAVVCDMDGTLLNGEHRVSERSKNIIKTIIEKGVKVFLASGRPYPDIQYFKKSLGLNSYSISSNGAVVHDEQGKEIMYYSLEKELLSELLNLPFGNLHRNLYTRNSWYVEVALKELLEFHKESGFAFQQISNLAEKNDGNATKLFFLDESEKSILDFEKKLKAKFEDRVSITLSTPNCLEIMKKGVNKGRAVKDTMQKLGIPLEEVIAFGDGLNDYEMLSLVGNPFVMSNASPRLLKALSEVPRAPKNTEDGVAQILERLFLK